jgi:hypothetical protein
MSYDPYSYEPDERRPGDPNEGYDAREDHDDLERPLVRSERLKGRVQAPGICLIVVGILNIFYALYFLVNGLAWIIAPDSLIKSSQQMFPGMQQNGMGRDQQVMVGIVESIALFVFGLVTSVLPVVGGVRMLALKSYALAVTGAVAAMIPCLSGMACCGLGEAAGIWALVVLLNPDVKSEFR